LRSSTTDRATVVAAGITGLWMSLGNGANREMWTELLVLQVVTLAILCGLLRLRGFRLQRIETAASAVAAAEQRRLQFGIRHVLVWTTALAMLLGLGKALDLLSWQTAQQLARDGMFWKLTVATTSAIVIIVALWVALGRGHWLARIVVGFVFALVAGSALAAWSIHNATVMAAGGGWRRRNWELLGWYEVGWWWLGWLFLSGGLLAATLIILRTRGYRLVRNTGRL
ncbi:MAG: hypothetical protein KY475_21615, partial [Planctomycetes bacterium]|nr:hypothetical protein [Planctomycetota bacterium]